jgi:hypothetical protein
VNERRGGATTAEKRGLRRLLSSSERLNFVVIRTSESELRADVRTWAMASVVAMDEEDDLGASRDRDSHIDAAYVGKSHSLTSTDPVSCIISISPSQPINNLTSVLATPSPYDLALLLSPALLNKTELLKAASIPPYPPIAA